MASYDLTQLIGFNFNGLEIVNADIANAGKGDPANLDYAPGGTTYNVTAGDYGANLSDPGTGPGNLEAQVTSATNGAPGGGNALALGQIVLTVTTSGTVGTPATYDVLGFSSDGGSILVGLASAYAGAGSADPYGGQSFVIANTNADYSPGVVPKPALETFTTTSGYSGGPYFEAATTQDPGNPGTLSTIGTSGDVVSVTNALVGKTLPTFNIVTTSSGSGTTVNADGSYTVHFTQSALAVRNLTFSVQANAFGPQGQPVLKIGTLFFVVVGFNPTQILLEGSSSTGVLTNRYNVLSFTNLPPQNSPGDLNLAFQNYGANPIAGAAYPCFATGTRIATPSGETAVEALNVGDLVLSAFGGAVEVVWLGHRTVECDRHPRRHDVDPVAVSAGAFGLGRPERELVLSPDHAVYVDGALIPIRYLVNGATIRQKRVRSVTYWHVELPAHDVVLAEGLPAESYLDTGNRGAFSNGGAAVHLHPDFSLRVWAAEACAELVLQGPRLEAAREMLRGEAEVLGFDLTGESGLRFEVDGVMHEPMWHRGRYCLDLPPESRVVRLLSRSGVPAETAAESGDTRRLGVAVSRITLDGRPIRLGSRRLAEGWHVVEEDGPVRRWTDGAASLIVPAGGRLEVTVAMTGRYWVEPPAGDTAGLARAG